MKTNELTGAALNWAVGKAEGLDGWLAPVNYCGKWEHGGPIIERELICLDCQFDANEWHAWTPAPEQATGEARAVGETPLVAAMRCYVASKLGDVVNVPEELV
jgi:hypothetical protein